MILAEEFESMEKGRKEAIIGLRSEKKIIQKINSNSFFQKRFRECLKHFDYPDPVEIEATEARKGIKTDILLIIGESKVGISVKSSTKTSFHQLDRRKLEKWKDFTKMSPGVFQILKNAILRITSDSKAKFILEKDQPTIKDFIEFNLDQLVKEVFRREEDNLKFLLINDMREGNIRLVMIRMADVISSLSENARERVSFSAKGIIRVGDYITIQRKGGNSSRVKIPKTDWSHPGNQLQFKFSPLKFVEFVLQERVDHFLIL